MNPSHDLRHTINVALVEEISPTGSKVNIELHYSSTFCTPIYYLSPYESRSETKESDDPFDFNIIIVETDEETDTVSSSDEQVVQPENQSVELPEWRYMPPFNHDFSYDYLSILSRDSHTGSPSHRKRTIRTPYSTVWNVEERPVGQGIEEVFVEDDQHCKRMQLRFSNGRLHGMSSFWSETGTVEGEWENGCCKWKTISCDKVRVTYHDEVPVTVETLDTNSHILYEYRNGFYTNRSIRDQWLYVEEVITTNEGVKRERRTISPASGSFRREGRTFVRECDKWRLDLYQDDKYVETLRLYQGNDVMVMRGSFCVYKGTYDKQCLVGPVKGFGDIYESNGNRYQGNVENGIPHGWGEYYVNGSLFYKGEFRYGVPHGKGWAGSGSWDSFVLGYRRSDGVSFGDRFSGLIIGELCGHLMLGNRLDENKLEKFPDYVKNRLELDEFLNQMKRQREAVRVVPRQTNRVAERQGRMAYSIGSYEESGERQVERSSSSIQRSEATNQWLFGSGTASMGMTTTSTNVPVPTYSPTPSLYNSISESDSYRHSSVSPIVPQIPTSPNDLPFDFDEYRFRKS